MVFPRFSRVAMPVDTQQVDEVIAAAKRAKEAGSTRFCMGAAWRELGNKKKAFNNILDMVRQNPSTSAYRRDEVLFLFIVDPGVVVYFHIFDAGIGILPWLLVTVIESLPV